MAVLKQSTSFTRMFLIVQSGDHITGLTGASPTVNISKAGGSFAAAGGTVTEVSSGWYKIALNTADTNTLGDLAYHITAASADPTDFVDQIAANILGDTLPANATQINGVSTSSVTTVNANVGTTQPTNFTGTGGTALVKSDAVDIAGSAVSTSSAQLGVNVVNWNAQTAQTDANNLPKVNVTDWNGSAVSALPGNFGALSIDGNGNVAITSNIKKNTVQNGFTFLMTDSTNHNPKTGLTVTATRSIDGGSFSSCANSVLEVANGTYTINLAAADTNGNHIMYRFASAGADDLNVSIITQP